MRLHTLDSIRLADFIDMWLGDAGRVIAEGSPAGEVERAEVERRARELAEQYIGIVGGAQVAARLAQENDRLKIRMRRVCLETARALLNGGDLDNAVKVLAAAGFTVTGDATDTRRRIDGWLAQDGYRDEKLRRTLEAEQAAAPVGRDWWVRERVALMKWARMYIDEKQMSASEYAWMLRAMCEDMRRAIQEQRKIKNRKNNV